MAGIPSRYYRVCDRCGEIVSLASDDRSEYICSECGALAAWAFTLHVKALDMQRQIRERVT
jgi:ribosomal protein S27AE